MGQAVTHQGLDQLRAFDPFGDCFPTTVVIRWLVLVSAVLHLYLPCTRREKKRRK